MAVSRSTHELLETLGLADVPHECSEMLCAGGFRWQAWSELESAARYAMNTGMLPPEAKTMLHAALHKLEALNKKS